MHVIGKINCALLSLVSSFSLMAKGDLDFEYASSFESAITTLHPSADIISPSATYILEKDDIQRSSANTLSELLSVVPGLHVGKYGDYHKPLFIMRGMSSRFNPQVLFMVNGVPITSTYRGDQQVIWGAYPIKSIERVEVIRGPNSAVQGANAMTGVINLITKQYNGKDETLGGLLVGSNHEKSAWFLRNFNYRGAEISLSGEITTTDGEEIYVARDNQTFMDKNFDYLYAQGQLAFNPPDASLADSHIQLGYEIVDLWSSIKTSDWHLNIGLQNRMNVEQGINSLNTIVSDGNGMKSYRIVGKFKTHPIQISENTNVQFNISLYQANQSGSITNELMPPGAGAGQFPNGMIGAPYYEERRINSNLLYTNAITETSSLALSLGYTYESLFDVEEHKNFIGNGLPSPDGWTEVSKDSEQVYIPEVSRRILSVTGEYIKYFGDDFELTTGLRFDHYSGIEQVTSPRLSLTWHFNHDLNVTAMHSRAYRAPTFSELYTSNNPVYIGNPDVSPETIENREIHFNYSPHKNTSVDLNVYHFTINDFIEYVQTGVQTILTPKNIGSFDGYGFELGIQKEINPSFSLNANYSMNEINNRYGKVTSLNVPATPNMNNVFKVGEYPEHQWLIAVNYHSSDDFKMGVNIEGIGQVYKGGEYNSNTLPSFMKLNLFITKEINNVSMKLSVRNLLNEQEYLPTDIKSFEHPKEIQTIRGTGRELTLGIQYQF